MLAGLDHKERAERQGRTGCCFCGDDPRVKQPSPEKAMALRGRQEADRDTNRTQRKKEALKAHRLKAVGLDLEMDTKSSR